eukprot:6177164-Pleurochrysis_carterae.AAC.2
MNIDKAGLLDGRTVHCGRPVLRGEKWGMNIWLRQRPFNTTLGELRVATPPSEQVTAPPSGPWMPSFKAPACTVAHANAQLSTLKKERLP